MLTIKSAKIWKITLESKGWAFLERQNISLQRKNIGKCTQYNEKTPG